MLYIILIGLVVLTVVSSVKREAFSPAFVVADLFSFFGYGLGALPETARTTVAVVKASNLAAVESLAETGNAAPKGFKAGLKDGAEDAKVFFTDANDWAKNLTAETAKATEERKVREAAEEAKA